MKIKCLPFLLFYATGTFAECYPAIPLTSSSSELRDNQDGTISDLSSGLMWRQCPGLEASDDSCLNGAEFTTWQEAVQATELLNSTGGFAGYADWRLPNVKELRTIVEEACVAPSINSMRFPNTRSTSHWTSTYYIGLSERTDEASDVLIVDFFDGLVSALPRANSTTVRLVRDE